MHDAMSFILLPVAGQLPTILFFVVAVPVLGFVALEMRRAAKAKAKEKNAPMKFLAPYRDEHGMPIFYDAGEDPSARYAQRVLQQNRRSNAEHQRTR